jgi:hypothetical protein
MKGFDIKKMEDANKKLLQNENNINAKNIVFIYTPIKVGSTTLVSSIRISAIEHFVVLHLHDEACLNVLTGIKDITINELILYNSMLGKKIYVIDVYRSPIERKISTFFELIEFHFNNSEEEINNYSIEKVKNRFNNLFLHIANEDYTKDKYEISVPESFDFEKKYLYIQKNNIHYIKLRLKDSHLWGNILSKLLGKEIMIINDYESSQKKISNLYSNFKNTYKIPNNLLEEIKSDTNLNYYYDQDEREKYINEWNGKKEDNMFVFTRNEYDFYLKLTKQNRNVFNIMLNHYIDIGCRCKVCDRKRKELLERVKRGEIVNEKINHVELVLQNIENIKKNIEKKILEKRVFQKKLELEKKNKKMDMKLN